MCVCVSLSAVLAASSGGAPLSLGPAPVTVLKCRREGPYGVGRPQQATGYVCKCFNLHAHIHKHTHILTSYSLLNWGGCIGGAGEVIEAVCVGVCLCAINPLSKDSLSC